MFLANYLLSKNLTTCLQQAMECYTRSQYNLTSAPWRNACSITAIHLNLICTYTVPVRSGIGCHDELWSRICDRMPPVNNAHKICNAIKGSSEQSIEPSSDRAMERSSDRAIKRSGDRAIQRSIHRAIERSSAQAVD